MKGKKITLDELKPIDMSTHEISSPCSYINDRKSMPLWLVNLLKNIGIRSERFYLSKIDIPKINVWLVLDQATGDVVVIKSASSYFYLDNAPGIIDRRAVALTIFMLACKKDKEVIAYASLEEYNKDVLDEETYNALLSAPSQKAIDTLTAIFEEKHS